MPRATDPLKVLALHQFPEDPDDGSCAARDGWGLYAAADDGGPPPSDNEQMAEHQLEKLKDAGFSVVRIGTDVQAQILALPCTSVDMNNTGSIQTVVDRDDVLRILGLR